MTELPLAGKRILVTRAKEQAEALSSLIRRYGGTAVEVPLIAFQAPVDDARSEAMLNALDSYEWLVFTSANGVRFFIERLRELPLTGQSLPVRIAAVGTKTEEALIRYGLRADLIPESFVAEGLLEALSTKVKKGNRLLLVRGNLGRSLLPKELTELGVQVEELIVYETVCPPEAKAELRAALKRTPVDYATFTSSSTVSHYAKLLKELEAEGVNPTAKIVCIGPISARTARQCRLSVDLMPAQYTIEAMVEQLVLHTKGEKEYD
ncbi:uroporphyrinogen-III synthase [Alkalihalobacillus oceani]|uniref:uroporphyrinogen-III synthase n=1 Tax=Halalkalibacter oceani TaxID=1653776 RepID=UPI00203FB4F8|nr:uroporphyrinogen-III synthase [Halalkalibacter oceani]MCM3759752.1 uroporphyrinogen-III synthase [Halalkalibacter oceani]